MIHFHFVHNYQFHGMILYHSFPADCSDPGTLTNGAQVGSPTYEMGTTVSFQCDSGYSLIGASVLTCNGGSWSHERPTCSGMSCDPSGKKD